MGCDKSKIPNHYPNNEEERAKMIQPYASALCYKLFKLQVGKQYLYCACGLSKNQPFCDGSHEGSKFIPIKFIPKKVQQRICLCRRSKKLPLCDGRHHTLDF